MKNFVDEILDAVDDIVREQILVVKEYSKTHYDETKNLGKVTLLDDKSPEKAVKKFIPTEFSIEDSEGYDFDINIDVPSELESVILLKQYAGTGEDKEITERIHDYFDIPKQERKGKYFNPAPRDTNFVNELREKINGKPEMP